MFLCVDTGAISSLPKTQEDSIQKVLRDAENTAESSAEPQLSDLPEFVNNRFVYSTSISSSSCPLLCTSKISISNSFLFN